MSDSIADDGAEMQLRAMVKAAEILAPYAKQIYDHSVEYAKSKGHEITQGLNEKLRERALREAVNKYANKEFDKVPGMNGNGDIDYKKLEDACNDIVKKGSYFFEINDYKHGIDTMKENVYKVSAEKYSKVEFTKIDKQNLSELEKDKKYSQIKTKANGLFQKGKAQPQLDNKNKLGNIESKIAQAKQKSAIHNAKIAKAQAKTATKAIANAVLPGLGGLTR